MSRRCALACVLPLIFACPSFAETWTYGATMPTARSELAAAAIGGKLYAVGGRNSPSGNSLNTLEVYDPATNTWTTGATIPTARYGPAAATIGSKLYAVGGWNGGWDGRFVNTLEIYDSATNTWSTGAPMPTARRYLAAAAINGKLYAVGGDHGSSQIFSNMLEIYDPATNTWTTGAPMPTDRKSLAAAAIDGKLYAVGGTNYNSSYLNTLEVYDPATNTWTTGTPMPTGRYGLAAAAIDGKLYAVGGDRGGGYLNTLEMYDPATNTWTTGAPILMARRSFAAAAIDGKLYAVGGEYGNYALSTLEILAVRPQLSLPSISTTRGMTVDVPVTATITGAYAVDLAFLADADAVESASIVSHAFQSNPNALSDIHMVGDSLFVTLASDEPISLDGGSLVTIALTIKADAPTDTVELRWIGYPFTEMNEGQALTTDGELTLIRYGDVTEDGIVSALDASWTLQYVVRKRLTINVLLADVTGNGRPSGYDAALILRKVIDPTYRFPVEGGSLLKPSPFVPPTLSWLRDGSGWVLALDDATGVLAGDLVIDLPDDVATAVSGGAYLAYAQDGTTLRIAFARLDDGTPFAIRLDRADLADLADLAEPPAISLVELNEGTVPVAAIVRPVVFSLAQNAPNPFNPSTTIRIGLPAASRVDLVVFDVNGQLVRTLLSADVTAGAHEIVWDATDGAGRSVASGVYVYHLASERGTLVRRMTLAR